MPLIAETRANFTIDRYAVMLGKRKRRSGLPQNTYKTLHVDTAVYV